MGDTTEPVVTTTTASSTATTTDAPITPNPTVSPAAETVTAPATDTPVEKPADAATNVTGNPETPTPPATESVLGDTKPVEAKTEAAAPEKKDDGDKPVETKAEASTEVKADLPVYEAFKVPENVTLDKEPLDAFTKILGEIETGKLDHLGMQEKGQALIDLAAKNTIESINRLNDYYVQFHENQKKEWFENFKKDPEMGGDKLDATVSSLRDAVETYAGNETQIAEFRTLMKETGVGNHPAVTRLLYNMQKKIDSYTKEGDKNRIVPGGAPAPSKVKDYQRFYQGGS